MDKLAFGLLAISAGAACSAAGAEQERAAPANGGILQTIELCEVCHTGQGRAIGEHIAPSLAGQNLKYMLQALDDLAQAKRPSPTGMRSMAQMLQGRSEKYIITVLEHLANQTVEVARLQSESEENSMAVAAGKAIADAICAACHGKQGMTAEGLNHIPNLAGQSREYIEQELRHFEGDTPARMHHTMAAIVSQLKAEDIENVAAYYESLGGVKGDD